MTTWTSLVVAVLLSVFLVACGDGGDGGACARPTDCDALNTRDGIAATACPRWFCGAAHVCVRQTVDADGDGHADTTCPSGDDCDDHDPHVAPGATEVCNGVDDDCDSVVDNAVFVPPSPPGTPGMLTADADGGTLATTGYGVGTAGGALVYAESAQLVSCPLAGTMPPSLAPLHAVTNAHDPTMSAAMDGIVDGTRSQTTSAAMDTCLVWNRGTVACTSDTDCLIDHGTCNTTVPDPGTCTGGSVFVGTSCLVPMGGTLVPDDSRCRQQQLCVRGTCAPPDRSDVAPRPCRFAETALDDLPDGRWLVAAIDRQGCGSGALRLLVGDPALTHLEQRGPEYRSNVYLGVDPYAGNSPGIMLPGDPVAISASGCTGVSRTDQRLGATQPSVAVLAGTRARALVGYIAPSRWQTTHPSDCGRTDTSPVSVIEAYVDPTVLGVDGVNGSNSGVPQELGTTQGVDAPVAVAALSADGYLVAFPDAAAGQAIALYYVPTGTPPAAYVSPGTPDGTYAHPRPTSPLVLPSAAIAHLAAGVTPDHVAIAPTPLSGGAYRVGIAWQEGCLAASLVKFAVVDVSSTGAASAMTTPVTVSAPMRASFAPTVAYFPDGFVRPGFRRTSGGPTATAASSGGWLVSFAGAGSGASPSLDTLFVRATALDGAPLEAPVAARPTETGQSVLSVGLYPMPETSPARAGYGAVDIGRHQVSAGTVLCRAPASATPDAGM